MDHVPSFSSLVSISIVNLSPLVLPPVRPCVAIPVLFFTLFLAIRAIHFITYVLHHNSSYLIYTTRTLPDTSPDVSHLVILVYNMRMYISHSEQGTVDDCSKCPATLNGDFLHATARSPRKNDRVDSDVFCRNITTRWIYIKCTHPISGVLTPLRRKL